MRFAICGAGAIGGYVGARLVEAGHHVSFLTRGRNLEAFQQGGLRISSPLGDLELQAINASSSTQSIGPVDIVIVTVKMPDLESVSKTLSPLLHSTTRIVTLQNGIDAKNIVGSYVDPAIVAQGVVFLSASTERPGLIRMPGGRRELIVDALQGNETMKKFFDAIHCSNAIEATPTENSRETVWEKFTAQSSIAAVTSLTRLTLGEIFQSQEATALLRQLLRETLEVARAVGVSLDSDHEQFVFSVYSQQPPEQTSSLMCDIKAGKPTELPWLSGRIHALGKQYGIATPAHSTTWLALAAYNSGEPRRAAP